MAPTSSDQRARGYVAATLKARIPLILKTAEEGQDAESVKQLRAIARSIEADGPMVLDYAKWPLPGWEALPGRVNGKRPSQASFFDFEYWLYFRILQAVRYPETRNDPFRLTRHRDLERHIDWAEQAIQRTRSLEDALNLALDANAHDLSQIAAPKSRYELGRDALRSEPGSIQRLNIIADNFGGEFVADLILATIAAEFGIETVIHVKHLPMFVSDTTTDDVVILFDRLKPSSEFGRRMQAQVESGKFRLTSNVFWSAPKFFDEVPVEELGTGDGVLNVLKGDLNFRRAIGDASVPIETPFTSLAIQPLVPLLALRSIKSYCVAGMKAWPPGVNRENFPMDGSIALAQYIPAQLTVSA